MKPDLSSTLTIYGRNPVAEALDNDAITVQRLHLAESNKPSSAIKDLRRQAERRDIEIRYHSKQELSRISKNGRQDQGVAADIFCPLLQPYENLLSEPAQGRLLAVDRINNPQNLGMLIRSACAGGIAGLLLPSEGGNTKLSPLVVKASAGTLFRFPVYRCHSLATALQSLGEHGYRRYCLAGGKGRTLHEADSSQAAVYVLGNESEGVSREVMNICDESLHIPMANQVESLNIAVTAALIAFAR
ncbi:MAG: RNA methyltransferase [Pseudomonadales bacterium]